jgi:hypothetical protein
MEFSAKILITIQKGSIQNTHIPTIPNSNQQPAEQGRTHSKPHGFHSKTLSIIYTSKYNHKKSTPIGPDSSKYRGYPEYTSN